MIRRVCFLAALLALPMLAQQGGPITTLPSCQQTFVGSAAVPQPCACPSAPTSFPLANIGQQCYNASATTTYGCYGTVTGNRCAAPGDWSALAGTGSFIALTGDATSTASGGATTITGANGAAIPASADPVATNSSKQLVAASLLSGDVWVGNGSNAPVATAESSLAVATAGNLTGTPALPNGTTATTQTTSDNTTKLATDAFVQSNAALYCLLTGCTMTGTLVGTVINPSTGYQIGGAAASGHYLRGNGINYVDATIQAGDVPTLNQSTSGNAATATALASYPTLCSGSQFSKGLSSGSNNCGTPSGGGGGTGNAASAQSVTPSTAATLTCGSSSAGTVDEFLSSALTANTTFTMASCTSGETVVITVPQAAGGPYTVTMGSGWDACPVSPTASATTVCTYSWDGTHGHLAAISSNDTPAIGLLSATRAAPTTVPSGGAFWPDSTDNDLEYRQTGSGTVFAAFAKGFDCAPVTGICTKTNGTAFSALATTTPGTGVATWIATPSGANLASALTSALPNTKGGTGGDSSGGTGVAQVNSGTWSYSTALANGTTGTTQTGGSNDTKVATDAYADAHYIANGTAAMNTAAVASGACETVVTVSASGVATTDVITVAFNGDPTSVTGYGASSTGAVLTIYPYPTLNNVNFKVCNSTANSITPSALTLNWKVVR